MGSLIGTTVTFKTAAAENDSDSIFSEWIMGEFRHEDKAGAMTDGALTACHQLELTNGDGLFCCS